MVHHSQIFSALADPTRLAMLEQLAAAPASVSQLAQAHAMSLTGMSKHLRVLEEAGLVQTSKVGRVRTCRASHAGLESVAAWIARHRRMLLERFDHLEQLLTDLEGEEHEQ